MCNKISSTESQCKCSNALGPGAWCEFSGQCMIRKNNNGSRLISRSCCHQYSSGAPLFAPNLSAAGPAAEHPHVEGRVLLCPSQHLTLVCQRDSVIQHRHAARDSCLELLQDGVACSTFQQQHGGPLQGRQCGRCCTKPPAAPGSFSMCICKHQGSKHSGPCSLDRNLQEPCSQHDIRSCHDNVAAAAAV